MDHGVLSFQQSGKGADVRPFYTMCMAPRQASISQPTTIPAVAVYAAGAIAARSPPDVRRRRSHRRDGENDALSMSYQQSGIHACRLGTGGCWHWGGDRSVLEQFYAYLPAYANPATKRNS